MSESPLEIFRRQFPAIVALVERSDSYRIDITLPHELIGVGASATVIIKHRNGRGFGMTWQIDRGLLHGLRSRRYDANEPDDAPANADWLAELARRLSTDGESRGSVAARLGISGEHYSHRARMRHALAKSAY
ncbi:hypothetical protein [Methylosinus sp. KRF6]|uniref:hypothetical protein n=1 Tax=Methylosinus sp. KRF6 TaxID=2846853 RepID=UPI001C0AA50A|nr:hypothetical protein [Methylosinus sp. KRF6]MBU3887584.1 hypothetical protein [Methylosinus sp. KRF6]